MTRATDLAIGKAAATGIGVSGPCAPTMPARPGSTRCGPPRPGWWIYLAVANANGLPPWGGTTAAGHQPAGDRGAVRRARRSCSTSPPRPPRTAPSRPPAPRACRCPRAGSWTARGGRSPTRPRRRGVPGPHGRLQGGGADHRDRVAAGVLNGAAFGSSVVDQRVDLTTPTNTGQLRRGPRGRRVPPAGRGARGRRGGRPSSAGPTARRPFRWFPGDVSAELWTESGDRASTCLPRLEALAAEAATAGVPYPAREDSTLKLLTYADPEAARTAAAG